MVSIGIKLGFAKNERLKAVVVQWEHTMGMLDQFSGRQHGVIRRRDDTRIRGGKHTSGEPLGTRVMVF